jgi:hypothetical protein
MHCGYSTVASQLSAKDEELSLWKSRYASTTTQIFAMEQLLQCQMPNYKLPKHFKMFDMETGKEIDRE